MSKISVFGVVWTWKCISVRRQILFPFFLFHLPSSSLSVFGFVPEPKGWGVVGDFGLNLLMIEGGIHVDLDSFEDVGAVAMAVGCATSTLFILSLLLSPDLSLFLSPRFSHHPPSIFRTL